MNVAFGLKAHSGWAALVVVAIRDRQIVIVDRRRLSLVERQWAKQPFHVAERQKTDAARDVIRRGTEQAQRRALEEMRESVEREAQRGHRVLACAVLVPDPMPDWTTEEILAVHFRMHRAEGVLFPDALVRAATACGLPVVAVPARSPDTYAATMLGKARAARLAETVQTLGKSVGPPWAKDQKEAAFAALIALNAQSA
jgi:hypothetical protein